MDVDSDAQTTELKFLNQSLIACYWRSYGNLFDHGWERINADLNNGFCKEFRVNGFSFWFLFSVPGIFWRSRQQAKTSRGAALCSIARAPLRSNC